MNKNFVYVMRGSDNNYLYSMHETDGGAIYLIQESIDSKVKNRIRLDGANVDLIIHFLNKIRKEQNKDGN